MATDATGTPTALGIPKLNTSVDAPSGLGENAMMDSIDALLTARVTKATWTTTGDILYASSANTPARLAIGASTSVLTVVGGVPAWAAASGIPAGVIEMWGGAAAPSGYVLCDGASYLRSGGGMDAVFAAIGTAFGFADGTHFNVPDLQGRFPVGKGTNASVNALNANDGQTAANRRPHHRTSITDPGHTHTTTVNVQSLPSPNFNPASIATPGTGATGSSTTGITVGSGNANDALDTGSFIVVNFIIKT